MKFKLIVVAVTLVSFSGVASGLDFGKLLKERINQELNKGEKTQPAPSSPGPDASQNTVAPAPPAKQKIDARQLGFALFGDYSSEEETRIGRQIAGDLLGAVPLVRDDKLQRYVNLVGDWVALQSGRNDVTWHFGVLDTEDINAFAAPGGYIFVTKGLYKRLNNEAELAGVLAHEIAHVTMKHHLKVLKQSSLIGALGQAVGNKVKDSDQVVQNLIGNGAEIMARGPAMILGACPRSCRTWPGCPPRTAGPACCTRLTRIRPIAWLNWARPSMAASMPYRARTCPVASTVFGDTSPAPAGAGGTVCAVCSADRGARCRTGPYPTHAACRGLAV